MVSVFVILGLCVSLTNAHLAVWTKGMYCRNGPQDENDNNASAPHRPLYMLPKSMWWFHHENKCDEYPPPEGEFLEIPAGKDFTVEISPNRATTTLSYDGRYTSEWVDGKDYPDAFVGHTTCITDPNIHTQNESMVAGTAFAISYQSELSKVTPENLVVFSIHHHSPWKRLTTYSVPAALPACPPDGCICAWGWVPNGCGEPNMYHQGFKCNVTGATATNPLAVAKPPVWCEGDPSKCTKGAKQMIYWNQLEGNNIKVTGNDLSGYPKSPAYNLKLGFVDGAQNDIFAPPSQQGGNTSTSATTSSLSPTVTSSALSTQSPIVTPTALTSIQSSIVTPSSSPTNTLGACTMQATPKHHTYKGRGPMAAYHHRRRIDSNSW